VSTQASRFTGALAALLGGGLTVTFAFAMRPRVEAWLSFAMSVAVLLVVAVVFAARDQGAAPRWLDAALVLVAAWSIVASRAFGSPHVLKWLCFADGVAVGALGLTGLIVHEVLIERRLHRLEADERYRVQMTRRSEREMAGRWFG